MPEYSPIYPMDDLTAPDPPFENQHGLDTGGGGVSSGIPIGGAPGQHLAKRTAVDYDVEWVDEEEIVPGTGGLGDVVGPPSSTNRHLAVFSTSAGKNIVDSGINADTLADRVTDLEAGAAEIAAATAKNVEQDTRLNGTEARLTTAETKNTQQDTRLSGAETRLSGAEGVNTSQDASITAIQGVNTSQGASISAIQSSLAVIDPIIPYGETLSKPLKEAIIGPDPALVEIIDNEYFMHRYLSITASKTWTYASQRSMLVAIFSALFNDIRRGGKWNAQVVPLDLDRPFVLRNTEYTGTADCKVNMGGGTGNVRFHKIIDGLNLKLQTGTWPSHGAMVSIGSSYDVANGKAFGSLTNFKFLNGRLDTSLQPAIHCLHMQNVLRVEISGVMFMGLAPLAGATGSLPVGAAGFVETKWDSPLGTPSIMSAHTADPDAGDLTNHGIELYNCSFNRGGPAYGTYGVILESGDANVHHNDFNLVEIGVWARKGGFNTQLNHYSIGTMPMRISSQPGYIPGDPVHGVANGDYQIPSNYTTTLAGFPIALAEGKKKVAILVDAPRQMSLKDEECDGSFILVRNSQDNTHEPGVSIDVFNQIVIQGPKFAGDVDAPTGYGPITLETFQSTLEGVNVASSLQGVVLDEDWGHVQSTSAPLGQLVFKASGGGTWDALPAKISDGNLLNSQSEVDWRPPQSFRRGVLLPTGMPPLGTRGRIAAWSNMLVRTDPNNASGPALEVVHPNPSDAAVARSQAILEGRASGANDYFASLQMVNRGANNTLGQAQAVAELRGYRQTNNTNAELAIWLYDSGVAAEKFRFKSTGGLAIGGASGPQVVAGGVDPSAGAGVQAPAGSIYLRSSGGGATTSFYVKTGAADTAWTGK